MIIPIFQPYGESSHLLAQRVGKLHNTKATHTGTLDPMASGVLVVLTAEDRFSKQKLSNAKKKYTFTIIAGIKTDTEDLLGLITKQESLAFDTKEVTSKIKNYFKKLPNTFEQKQHTFSAARTEIPTNQVSLYSWSLDSSKTICFTDLLAPKVQLIKSISGEFRQREILQQWKAIVQEQKNMKVIAITISIETSKRFYVRSLVRDIGQAINTPLVTSQIIRTQNGPYSISDCTCLIQ